MWPAALRAGASNGRSHLQESWKVLEAQVKMRPKSNAGLALAVMNSPRTAAKVSKQDWLNLCLQNLDEKIEMLEVRLSLQLQRPAGCGSGRHASAPRYGACVWTARRCIWCQAVLAEHDARQGSRVGRHEGG